MRQDKLNRENQKCHHGYFMGTTCDPCRIEELEETVKGLHAKLDKAKLHQANQLKVITLRKEQVRKMSAAMPNIVNLLGVRDENNRLKEFNNKLIHDNNRLQLDLLEVNKKLEQLMDELADRDF